MIIERVINNNVVSVLDQNGRESILMGKGLGFQKRSGDKVNETKIEKHFLMESESQSGQFAELIKNIPETHLKIAMEIIEYAQSVLPRKLGFSVYISLTDHINFAVERVKKRMDFENPLLNEVRSFYPSEYLVGEYGVALIRKNLGVSLSVDEAASIAMHLVNGEYDSDMSTTMHVTTLIKEVIGLVEEDLGVQLNELGLYYSRFVTHLKFLSQRLFLGQQLNSKDRELSGLISKLYPVEYEIAGKIAALIQEKYEREITDEEQAYLTVHIRRVRPDADEEE